LNVLCRQPSQRLHGVGVRGRACDGNNSACGATDTHLNDKRRRSTDSTKCVAQLCADCHVLPTSKRRCRPARRLTLPNSIAAKSHHVSASKRRINDVMSQCIQAYCTDVLHHVRIACILHHCNRSRRSLIKLHLWRWPHYSAYINIFYDSLCCSRLDLELSGMPTVRKFCPEFASQIKFRSCEQSHIHGDAYVALTTAIMQWSTQSKGERWNRGTVFPQFLFSVCIVPHLNLDIKRVLHAVPVLRWSRGCYCTPYFVFAPPVWHAT